MDADALRPGLCRCDLPPRGIRHREVGPGLSVRTMRKRPGTVGICAALMNRYEIETVPHIICGFSVEETEMLHRPRLRRRP